MGLLTLTLNEIASHYDDHYTVIRYAQKSGNGVRKWGQPPLISCYYPDMPRVLRTDAGNYIYHVLNRANARVRIFDDKKDYELFELILEDAIQRYDMRLLAYCIIPDH